MCLITFLLQPSAETPVLLAANREESFSRPSHPPQIVAGEGGTATWLGGTDGESGGTWLGLNEFGIIIAITNRNDRPPIDNPRSRGLLCRDLLELASLSRITAELDRQIEQHQYAGFNLLAISRDQAVVLEYGSDARRMAVSPGLHVLANSGLNQPDDVRSARAFREFRALADNDAPPTVWTDRAPRLLALSATGTEPALCIDGDDGTVSATVIALPADAQQTEYLFAAGPPDRTPFASYSRLARQLLTRGKSPRSNIHRIHLKGPWDCMWLSGGQSEDQSRRVVMPADWSAIFGNTSGTARFTRRFHRPSNIDPRERVLLVFDGVGGAGDVTLNGAAIGTIHSATEQQRFDVKQLLEPFNELTVELQFDPAQADERGGLYAPVALEIEEGTSAVSDAVR